MSKVIYGVGGVRVPSAIQLNDFLDDNLLLSDKFKKIVIELMLKIMVESYNIGNGKNNE